jgi:hypothetical protein
VAPDRLHDLVAHRVGRVERGHRLLEDHGEPVAAQGAQAPLGLGQEIPALEAHGARHLRPALRQEAHDGEGGDALAAAGFADDAEGSPALDGEADAVHRHRAPPVAARKGDAQVLDLKKGTGAHSGVPAALAGAAAACAAAMDSAMRRSISARSVIAGRVRLGGHELAVVQEALVGDPLQPGELGERVRVVVDADVEERVLLLVVDEHRGRLPAALVAARLLAGLERRKEAARTGGGRTRTRRPAPSPGSRRRPASMLPATEKFGRTRCPNQGTHSRP